MFRFWVLLLSLMAFGRADASYLDEIGAEKFVTVYKQLGIELSEKTVHDPQVWQTLEKLKREACDQKSLDDLAILLDRLGYRREAALSQYNFVKNCGAPTVALHKSIDLLFKLSDHAVALEVADEYVRRAPNVSNAHYLRGVALQGLGDYNRAVTDYANAIELFGADRKNMSSTVFLRMAEAYAKLGRYCEAATPILIWVAIDPLRRDNNRTQKIIADYERQGNCAASTEARKERYALRGGNRVVKAHGEINGVKGVFIIDTGASYISIKKAFADRAKIDYANGGAITLYTANGTAKGKLAKADAVTLGRLNSRNVAVVVQDTEARSYGPGVDGLLGMSFLSRFEVQMSGGFLEIRTRRRK